MRNTKDSTLGEPLIHLSIWIRNDVMNKEDDEAEKLPSMDVQDLGDP